MTLAQTKDFGALVHGVGALADETGVGARFARHAGLVPASPPPASRGTVQATNAWLAGDTAFRSSPNRMSIGNPISAGTRVSIVDWHPIAGFLQAFWPGRGWGFVEQTLVRSEASIVETHARTLGALGAIGKLGNANSIAAGTYVVSGYVVALRDQPSFSAKVITRLNAGDEVDAPDGADLPYDASPGTDPNFPLGTAVYFTPVNYGGQSGYVAVGYLSPQGTAVSGGGGGGGGAQPVGYKPPADQKSGQSASGSDYTVPVLIGATVIGLGIIGWAVFSKPKRKK